MDRIEKVTSGASTPFPFPEPTHRSRFAVAVCPSHPDRADAAHRAVEVDLPRALGALGITGRVTIRFSELRSEGEDDVVAGAGIEIEHALHPGVVEDVVRVVARHLCAGERLNTRSLVVSTVDHRPLQP